MGIIKKPERVTIGNTPNLNELVSKIYDLDEINEFQMNEAINTHPLVKRPTAIRSKMAYSSLLKQVKPTKRYLLPGQIVLFNYSEPKFKEDLEY